MEEIPMLIPIPDTQSKKRQISLAEKAEQIAPKKKKLSETEKSGSVKQLAGNESEVSSEKQSKLTKKEKRKLNAEKKAIGMKAQSAHRRESEDSGIEEEIPTLKLTSKSFWDILPSLTTSNDENNQNQVKSDPESDEDMNEESDEVKGADEPQTIKNTKTKGDKRDKKLPKVTYL